MGVEYALVHVKYTIPPALLFTILYRPFFTARDWYRIAFLIVVTVTATIPWDSYLIRSRVWSYPQDAVLGPTIFSIPIEELFFFIIQTYDVSLFYLLASKATFSPAYLEQQQTSQTALMKSCLKLVGQVFLLSSTVIGAYLIQVGGPGTYLGLIAAWALPFLLLLWSLSSYLIINLPYTSTIWPIAIPTVYLWVVDTFSLQRGTWVIEEGTKCGIHLWPGLELEEAIFFLVTNMLIVFGQIAFENAVAIIDLHADIFPGVSSCPSPKTAIQALLLPVEDHNSGKIAAVSQGAKRLQKKSRSFYLASSTFAGRLRLDLILLYSFCRLADDLIDSATTLEETQIWISRLRRYLDLAYAGRKNNHNNAALRAFVESNFPSEATTALAYLPVSKLSPEPLYDLLRGFEVDVRFLDSRKQDAGYEWPIKDVTDLKKYGSYVAGTIAELCLDLVFYHSSWNATAEDTKKIRNSAQVMGVALQTVNIARDIRVDADLERVYIPSSWLDGEGLTPEMVMKDPSSNSIKKLRSRLLDLAFELYSEARPSLDQLPSSARGPMRVAIESYMEIGRVLRDETCQVKAGRATVPVGRRLLVAWKTLNR